MYSLLFVHRETPARQGPWCGSGRLAAAVTSHGSVFIVARDVRVKPRHEPSALWSPFSSTENRCRPFLKMLVAQLFSTWPNSNSTGVARPKIDTATLRRERAS